MDDKGMDFFQKLLETPSPSGYEQPVQQLVRAWAGEFADTVKTDLHGNVIAVLNPSGTPRVLLDGHCDQIGLLVQHIDEEGFLYVLPIGGWDPQILLGQQVTVWSASGPQAGVIARKAKHLLKPDELNKVPEIADLWVDIGAQDKQQAANRVAVGDPVTVRLGLTRLGGPRELLVGPKMDDTTGLWVVLETLRRLHGRELAPAVYVVSAVQEEIGLRGAKTAAYGIDPHVGIAVDVTHATDCPTIDKRQHGDVRLGAGPVLFRGPNINPKLHARLLATAQQHNLPVQHKGAAGGTANDANVLQLTRAGVATACLGLPNRYMHSPVEMVSWRDLDTAAELLTQMLMTLEPDSDFVP